MDRSVYRPPFNILRGLKTCGICGFISRDCFTTIVCHDRIVKKKGKNKNGNSDLKRWTILGDHNAGPNEPAMSPYETTNGYDPLLTQSDHSGLHNFKMTQQGLTGCSATELTLYC